MGLIAYRYYTRVRIRYPTRIVLLFTDVINYIFLRILFKRPGSVHGTYYIHLVILELSVPFIEVEYVIRIIYSEYTICCVPMYVEGFRVVPHDAFDEEY